MKLIEKIKSLWQIYKQKYIEPPIKEKYIELKKEDKNAFDYRVHQEVSRVIFKQYILPAIIIVIFSSYSAYYYLHQFLIELGVF